MACHSSICEACSAAGFKNNFVEKTEFSDKWQAREHCCQKVLINKGKIPPYKVFDSLCNVFTQIVIKKFNNSPKWFSIKTESKVH